MILNENTILTTTPYGDFFVDTVCDQKMSSQLVQGKHPNAALVELAMGFVDTTSIVLDIGAHIGTFAIPVSHFAASVIAFEPSPDTYATLMQNVTQNNRSVAVRNHALGAREERRSMVERSAHNAGAHTLVAGDDIAVYMLDQQVPHADFIKMDVEGMEAEVLFGGVALIERSRPVVFFELNLSQLRAHGSSPRVLEQFFARRGYRLFLPIEKTEGTYELARVRSLTLLAALIAPRAWFFHSPSAPFDILAVPKESTRAYQVRGAGYAAMYAIQNNLTLKIRRVARWFTRV